MSNIQIHKAYSTYLFGFSFSGSKKEFIDNLHSIQFPVSEHTPFESVWKLGDFNKNHDANVDPVTASWHVFENKLGTDSVFFSQVFRFQCGEKHVRHSPYGTHQANPSIYSDVYTIHQMNPNFRQKLNLGCIKLSSADAGLKITNAYMIVCNYQQAILIIEFEHQSTNTQELLQLANLLESSPSQKKVNLHRYISEEHYTPNTEPAWYLSPFISKLPSSIENKNTNKLEFLSLLGWIIYGDTWITGCTQDGIKISEHLRKNYSSHRMHHINIAPPANEEIQYHTSYFTGDTTFSKNIQVFVQNLHNAYTNPFDSNINTSASHVMQQYQRNNRHTWCISKDATLSAVITHKNDIHFVQSSFHKYYQMMVFQVLLEYIGIKYFNYIVGTTQLTAHSTDIQKLRMLMADMTSFRLSTDIINFSSKARYAKFYASLRTVFNIEELINEVNTESKAVLDIAENREYINDSEKEKQEKREKEAKEREENEHKVRQEKLISIITIITVPFAIGSGFMGMNTNEGQCTPLSTQLHDFDIFNPLTLTSASIPCISFLEFGLLCALFSSILLGITYLLLWKKNPYILRISD